MLVWMKGVLAPWAEWYFHGGKACTQEPTWNAWRKSKIWKRAIGRLGKRIEVQSVSALDDNDAP